MIYENQPPGTLPVRGRSPLPSGRHRRPESADLPPDAPALVLVAPGDAPDVATEIAALTRAARAEIDVRVAALGGSSFADVLAGLPADRPPIIMPLVTGPHPQIYDEVRAGLAAAGISAKVTDPLGPHPLLAEAVHVRLADAGLARADRIRQFSIGAPIDGVILVTVGGEEATQEAEVTAVLLAARLAVPVLVAAVDGVPTVGASAARLRESGAQRLAVAPYAIGPEADMSAIRSLADEVGAGCAGPLGAHSVVGRLVNLRYEVALDEEGRS